MLPASVIPAASDDRQRTLAVVVTLLAIAIDQLTTPVIAPALRAVAASLGSSAASSLWFTIGFNASYFAAIALSFWFIAVIGKRVYFGATFLGFALASLVCALAPNGELLLVGRVAQGFAMGGLFTSALLTLMGACKPQQIPVAFAWFSIVSLATPSLAPLLSGMTLATGNWRTIFLILAIPAVIGGVAGLVLFKDPYAARPVPFNALSFVALASFLVAFHYVANAGAEVGWFRDASVSIAAVIVAPALGAYILIERRSSTPFFNLGLFEAALVGQGVTIGILLGLLLSSASTLLQFVMGTLHFSPRDAAWLLAIRFAGIIVGVPAVTILSGKRLIGPKQSMLTGLGVLAASFVAQHSASLETLGFAPFAAIGIVQGFAFALILGPLASVIFGAVKHDDLPSMAILFKLSTLIGAALSTPLVALFLDASTKHYGLLAMNSALHAYADLWIAGAIVTVFAAAIVVLLRIPPARTSA